jgi:transposase
LIDPFVPYLRGRVVAYPGLTGRRLWRELRERGYEGGYTAITDLLRDIRPAPLPAFEVRFETPPGDQAQVDFAHFQVQFTGEPTITRIIWLLSFVLGFSRLTWARFVLHQDMQTVLRCHMAAFEAIDGVPNDRPCAILHQVQTDRHRKSGATGFGNQDAIAQRSSLIRPPIRHARPTPGAYTAAVTSTISGIRCQHWWTPYHAQGCVSRH